MNLENTIRIGLGVVAGSSHAASIVYGTYKGSLDAQGIDTGVLPVHFHMLGTALATAAGFAASTDKKRIEQMFHGALTGAIAAPVELAVGYLFGYATTWITNKF